MARREWRVRVGLSLLTLALLGWIGTLFITPVLQHPDTAEDLTAVWRQAGATPLGQSTTVTVPPGQTLVAFLVGTDLYGISGTTGGSCAATAGGRQLGLGWPVLINRSLTGILEGDEQTVPIAGWTNRGNDPASVAIRCSTSDSTVNSFVAVPSRTAVIARDPWFQPWGWIALGAAGIACTAMGALRINRPNR